MKKLLLNCLNYLKNRIPPALMFAIYGVILLNSFWLHSGALKSSSRIMSENFTPFSINFIFKNIILGKEYIVLILLDRLLLAVSLCLLLAVILKKIISWNKCFHIPPETSKTDIIFVLIFLLLLPLPMTKIDKTNKSDTEARNFAQYKPLLDIKNKKINPEYGKNLNEWFNDRFLGRIYLVYLNRYLIINSSNSYAKYSPGRVVDKKTKNLHRHWKANIYQPETAKEIYKSIKTFSDFCKENNIKLYFVVVPDKELLYSPKPVLDTGAKDISAYINVVSNNGEITTIYPYESFIYTKNNTNNLLFYKTDHHATDDGIYLVYKAIIKELQKTYKNVKLNTPSQFNYFTHKYIRAGKNNTFSTGQTCNLLGISPAQCEKFHDVNYRYYHFKDERKFNIIQVENDTLLGTKFQYDKGADLRVVLVGDSFTESLARILPSSFKYVFKIRLNGPKGIATNDQFKIMRYNANDILNYKPDIVILCVNYSNIQRLKRVAQD